MRAMRILTAWLMMGALLLSALPSALPSFALTESAGDRYRYLAEASQLSPKLNESVEEVLGCAEALCEAVPPTVTDKETLPPGADPHDFVSLSIYAWQNPETPDGLPYVLRDGERNPEADDESRYDEARLFRMVDSVTTLNMAYGITQDEKYAEKAKAFLETWFIEPETAMRPSLAFAQCVPGVSNGESYGIICTAELIRLVDSMELLEASPCWEDSDSEALKGWFGAYVDWLLSSPNGVEESQAPNNHSVWYDAQVAVFAAYAGDTDLAREVLESAKHLRIEGQIEPSGAMPQELRRTKPFAYTLYALKAFVELAEAGEKAGVDLWNYQSGDGRSIRKALDYVVPLLNGGSTQAFYQTVDAWQLELEGESYHQQESFIENPYFAHYLASAYLQFGAPAYRNLALKLSARVGDTENLYTDELLRQAYEAYPQLLGVTLLTNGNFETGKLAPWVNWRKATVQKSGAAEGLWAARLSGRTAGFGQEGLIGFPGNAYCLSAQVKCFQGAKAQLGVKCCDAEGKTVKDFYVLITGDSYQMKTLRLVAPAGTVTLQPYLYQLSDGSVLGDGFVLLRE